MNNNNFHNQQCAATNSLLSQYGFVEEYETVVKDGKKEEQRFLYLQLKPTIGLLVCNFYHTMTQGNLQGFDMFMYNSNNVQEAILQFHGQSKYSTKVSLLSLEDKIEQTGLIIEKLQKEDCNEYFAVESKYNKLIKETYKRANRTDGCNGQLYTDSDSME